MNAEQANRISLCEILMKLGYMPAEKNGNDFMFFSPFRNEKTPSFHVHIKSNIWYDFGESKGGNNIDFACCYLESRSEDHTVIDALRWLANMQPSLPAENHSNEDSSDCGPVLELKKSTVLQSKTLIDYLHSRGIPHLYAKKHLKEVYVRNANTGKLFYAAGILNENGGYALRNKFFKGCIAPQSISFIRGNKVLPEEIHVFEGFMDYLSALVFQKKTSFEGDTIILNSTGNLAQAFPYIRNYSYKVLYSWLDNDNAGEKAMEALNRFIAEEGNLKHKPMNAIYAEHKDVNEWHMHRHRLIVKNP